MISLNWIDNDGLLSPDNHDINREPDGNDPRSLEKRFSLFFEEKVTFH